MTYAAALALVFIAGFVAGSLCMRARARQAIAPFSRGCVSREIVARATAAIDRLHVARRP